MNFYQFGDQFSMIREELLHTAASHFPIALLVLVLFTKIAELIVTRRYKNLGDHLNIISKFLLILGSVMLIPSLFLGDMAFDIVKKDICNLITAYRHEDMAHNTLIVFIVAIVLETCLSMKDIKKNFILPLKVSLVAALILGNYFLFQTAHLGGDLVYTEGAGVLRVLKKCD